MRREKKTASQSPDGVKGYLSRSFVTGSIAILFMVTGYQAALLLHRAATVAAVSSRDHPDTVYIYLPAREGASFYSDSAGAGLPEANASYQRHYSPRRSPASVAADRLSPPRAESFPFNPNTASVEDFVRLGFSRKQAEAILRYRSKGGRFRRKEDFARSYVVSDSVYRRLEGYIRIPKIDLNKADTAQLRTLPGIGKFYASRIVEYRKALKGYSYKEQLMDIWRFDAEKFAALEDLVTVSAQSAPPYPLWSLPADSLALHPYIGPESAKGIVLFRDNSPKGEWTVENLKKNGILLPENADKLAKCRIVSP